MDDFLERPVMFLDVETTGIDLVKDRIVEIGLVKWGEIIFSQGFNPGIPMSAEAAQVTGLTDEILSTCPPFREHAQKIFELLTGHDIAGHNIVNFDVPILVEEFSRCGLAFPEQGTQFIDTQRNMAKIFPRTLASAFEIFTGRKIDNAQAHGACYDAMAAEQIYFAQAAKYTSVLGTTREALHAIATNGKQIVDFAGKLKLNDKFEICWNFGKNLGKRVTSDLSYLQWVLGTEMTMDTRRWIDHAIKFDCAYYPSKTARTQNITPPISPERVEINLPIEQNEKTL